jgi:hypothetical protein
MMVGMDEYQRDAYVIDMSLAELSDGNTHAVVVDVIDGPIIVHQVVSVVPGKTIAWQQARLLNAWRNQTRFEN